MTFVPFGEFAPDQPDYQNPASSFVFNAIPLTADAYGPIGALARYTTTGLTARCQGFVAATDQAANITQWAGTATDLYKLAGLTWTNASSSAGAYALAVDAIWSFATFGSNLYANCLGSQMQVAALTGSTFAAVATMPTPPRAKYMAVVRDFLVLGNTYDTVNGSNAQRVWWSGINAPQTFPTPGTAAALAIQSDYQDIAGSQGLLQGIVANLGFADAAIFFERAIFRMQYVGSPAIFSFTPAEGLRGTPAPQSIVQFGATVYYLGEDGFYAFDGANSTPIGAQKVDFWFFALVDPNYFYRIQGAVDPINKVISWAFAGSGNTMGTPNFILHFHPQVDRWSYSGISTEFIARSLSTGFTLEQLSAAYPNIETVPASLDSRIWTGGKISLAAFDPASHNISFFTGPNMAPQIQTTEVQPNPAGRASITRVRPIVRGIASGTVQIAHRETISADPTLNTPAAINPYGYAPQRADGRFHRAIVTVPAGAVWTNAQGVELDAVPLGDI